jgi:organic hydroperoxide reductase OsmC/OhrA
MRAHCGTQRENRLSKLTQRHKRGHIELSQQLVVDVRLLGLERIVAEVLVDEAERLCPYSRAIRGNVEVTVTLL